MPNWIKSQEQLHVASKRQILKEQPKRKKKVWTYKKNGKLFNENTNRKKANESV